MKDADAIDAAFRTALAGRLVDARRRRDLSVRSTDTSGVGRKVVERIETGGKRRLPLAQVYLLAMAYGADLRCLLRSGEPWRPWPSGAPSLAVSEAELRAELRRSRELGPLNPYSDIPFHAWFADHQQETIGTPAAAVRAGVYQSWWARAERGDVELDLVRLNRCALAMGRTLLDLLPTWRDHGHRPDGDRHEPDRDPRGGATADRAPAPGDPPAVAGRGT